MPSTASVELMDGISDEGKLERLATRRLGFRDVLVASILLDESRRDGSR
jgi:hypothetical protein